MKKVLFTTIYDPDLILGRWAATDQMAYRLTRGQGIFTLQEHAHSWPLHLLAQNIEAESVVLEWPTLEELEEECARQLYDYVCISFMNRDINKLAIMSRSIRRILPKAQIVIGGYGVICMPDEEGERRAQDYDHICRGEGVQFMRTLLGESTARPARCRLPQSGSTLPWLSPRSRGTVGALLPGLGCIQRCPFCVTSFYAKGGFIPLMDERQLYEGMLYYWRANPFTVTVNVYDENFIDYKDRVDALGRLIREDPEHGLRQLNYFTFGSISALCKYDPEELLLNGLDTVWIGVESYFTGLKKTQGAQAADVFAALHSIGIKTIGSWINGLDVQNRANIATDEDYFVSLCPTFQQISILTVEPNMPLARRYGINPRDNKYPWENYHLYGRTFEPSNFTYEEMLDRVEGLYRRMYHAHGPSITRMLRVNLNGYLYCKRSSNPKLRDDKALFFERRVRSYAPLLAACRELAPTEQVRRDLEDLDRQIADVFGSPNGFQQQYREHVLRKAAAEHALRGEGERPPQKDGFRRYTYGPESTSDPRKRPYTVERKGLRPGKGEVERDDEVRHLQQGQGSSNRNQPGAAT